MTEVQRRLMTRAEVAQLLGIEQKTLSNWRYRGVGPASFKVGKVIRYRHEAVERWVAEQEAAGRGGNAA